MGAHLAGAAIDGVDQTLFLNLVAPRRASRAKPGRNRRFGIEQHRHGRLAETFGVADGSLAARSRTTLRTQFGSSKLYNGTGDAIRELRRTAFAALVLTMRR